MQTNTVDNVFIRLHCQDLHFWQTKSSYMTTNLIMLQDCVNSQYNPITYLIIPFIIHKKRLYMWDIILSVEQHWFGLWKLKSFCRKAKKICLLFCFRRHLFSPFCRLIEKHNTETHNVSFLCLYYLIKESHMSNSEILA